MDVTFCNTTGDTFLGLSIDAEGIRFVGGSYQLPLKLAEQLKHHTLVGYTSMIHATFKLLQGTVLL
jgi:hypothetical protein